VYPYEWCARCERPKVLRFPHRMPHLRYQCLNCLPERQAASAAAAERAKTAALHPPEPEALAVNIDRYGNVSMFVAGSQADRRNAPSPHSDVRRRLAVLTFIEES
jgi:hypothetical protein